MFPFLFRKEIKDAFAQTNFSRIMDYFRDSPLERCGFQFFEIVIPAAVTNYAFPHNLGYQPKDVLVLHNLTNAGVLFNYSRFTDAAIDITTTGATTLRILLGRYA